MSKPEEVGRELVAQPEGSIDAETGLAELIQHFLLAQDIKPSSKGLIPVTQYYFLIERGSLGIECCHGSSSSSGRSRYPLPDDATDDQLGQTLNRHGRCRPSAGGSDVLGATGARQRPSLAMWTSEGTSFSCEIVLCHRNSGILDSSDFTYIGLPRQNEGMYVILYMRIVLYKGTKLK